MGPRPNRPQQRPPQRAAEPNAAEHRLALGWRESWRRKTTETEKPGANAANQRPDGEEKKRRARFAAQIARSEFGRHYWDARREASKRPPPQRNDRARD